MDRSLLNVIFKGLKVALFGSNLRAVAIARRFQDLNVDVVSIKAEPIEVNLEEVDLCILGGWSKLIKPEDLAKPRFGFINCHAGRLPEYRGSSPLNWSILNNEKKFGLSVMLADANFDTGDILVSREFDLLETYNITDLHEIANSNFPDMVVEAAVKLVLGMKGYSQPKYGANYYPLRSPDDGEIDWYLDDAQKIAQKIKALQPPYHGCFCFFKSNKVFFQKLISIEPDFRGEVGKIYRVKDDEILISTTNGSIWVEYRSDAALRLKPYEIFDK